MSIRKKFLTINCIRKAKVKVILNEYEVIYKGEVEEVPYNIGEMKYSRISTERDKEDNVDYMNVYVYND